MVEVVGAGGEKHAEGNLLRRRRSGEARTAGDDSGDMAAQRPEQEACADQKQRRGKRIRGVPPARGQADHCEPPEVREARGQKKVFEATANPSLARTVTFMVDDLAGQRAVGNIDDKRVPVGFGGGDAAPDFEHPRHLRNRPLRVVKMLQDAVNPAGVEGMVRKR